MTKQHEKPSAIVTTDLARAREIAGVTQHELAGKLEGVISRSYLAMIETGKRPFPLEHVDLVGELLDEAYAERVEFNRKARELIERISPFTEQDRRVLEAQRRAAEQRLVDRNKYGA